MIRDALTSIDHGFFATAALLLFVGVFMAVSIRTLLTNRSTTQSHAELPLSDEP